MNEKNLNFLVSEYVQLWDEHGIEDLKPKKSVLKQKITSKKAPTRPVKPEKQQLSSLEDVQTWLGNCERCGLCKARSKIVFGSGSPVASLVFVGEGPGADEDTQGQPFVGKAGQLLTKIIEAMGFQREDVYIANVVKCRPPGNRTPEPEEIAQCMPFLKAQIDLLNPKILVALGNVAARALTGQEATMSNMRGKFHSLTWNSKLPVMPTYHPAYLLRNPDAKRIVWDDMKQVKARLEGAK
jgi:uracil-DNA glycosylase family 4